ncbi:MAG: hypothetical protein HKN23_20105 [Verrucomicrobiales bacterium]|nr:hypothetical protein [Verrucomicrobiales bacterium]
MSPIRSGLILAFFAAAASAAFAQAPPSPHPAKQLLVSVADSWGSKSGKLQGYNWDGSRWVPAFDREISVLYGRNGLAWGRGNLPVPSDGRTHKREGDGKAPAGFFAITKIYGYARKLPRGADFPYRQVSKWDAWPDDVNHPNYNQHIVIDPKKGVPSWFESQKMRHGDFAYKWLIEIRHNADPPKPGAGSAIFMHIRRGPNRYTAGCTSMLESDLVKVIQFLQADKKPHYVLLPKAEYAKLKGPWNLP